MKIKSIQFYYMKGIKFVALKFPRFILIKEVNLEIDRFHFIEFEISQLSKY